MIALVATAGGIFSIDLESEELVPSPPFERSIGPVLNLPRLLDTAQTGSTIVALVDARPPMLVSHDAGSTWRESGRGLPAGRAVAVSPSDPDTLIYAARNRLFVSRNGGVFWTVFADELPEIASVALRES